MGPRLFTLSQVDNGKQLTETTMNENVPFIWRKNYRNEAISPERVLENAHEKARQYLQRAAKIHESSQRKH